MNIKRIITMISIPAAAAAIMLAGSINAGAATPATAPLGYSQGAVNIDLTITNNSDAPMTLTYSALAGDLDHWDKRPETTLGAHTFEEVTGYSHNLASELDMAITYSTSTDDMANFDVQANVDEQTNSTTGTDVVQNNGIPANDLTINATITQQTDPFYDYSVASATIQPAS